MLQTPTAPSIVVERRNAAVIIEQGPAALAGQPAYAATIDVANIDQVRLSPAARSRRVQLVLMRAPRAEEIDSDPGDPDVHSVLILAGYSNMITDFPVGLEDFHDLLRRLTVGGRSGLTLGLKPVAAEPGEPAAAPQAAPADPATTP